MTEAGSEHISSWLEMRRSSEESSRGEERVRESAGGSYGLPAGLR